MYNSIGRADYDTALAKRAGKTVDTIVVVLDQKSVFWAYLPTIIARDTFRIYF